MIEKNKLVLQKYIMTWRIIQPARVQDVVRAYSEIWNEEVSDFLKHLLYEMHSELRESGILNSVRKGTYVLSKEGMEMAATFAPKERLLDNARLFLMKRQRKSYRRFARRLG
jgi:hypothetical protein